MLDDGFAAENADLDLADVTGVLECGFDGGNFFGTIDSCNEQDGFSDAFDIFVENLNG